MDTKSINVVGNVFKNLSNGKDVVTFNEALEIIRKKDLESSKFIFGQGVSELQILGFERMLGESNNSQKVTSVSYFEDYLRCPKELTHKNNACNTLISEPIKNDSKTFNSLLMIDDRCADLSDHVSCKHIQFMVLIEAARQMVNAVTEKFYSNSCMVFLANNINSEFKSFVYPFRVDLNYKVNEKKMNKDGNGRMSIGIDFTQFDKLCVKFLMDLTVLDRKFVTSIEDEGIKSVVGK